MELFTYDDLKKIDRPSLGKMIPLELFRSVRLIGMYQGLPMNGKNTTMAVGRKIGQSLPVKTIEEALAIFKDLKIGIPTILDAKENEFHIKIDDCFCKGLPVHEGNMTCDLEGAILEGAFSLIYDKKVIVREVKCNVNGDEHCEYIIKLI
ncbi:V4R domain-containing protein [Neobacillus jeddahensis]|uniref:V4R domain-containing protein n=1 Tax=Neobacillus jeddahensis TaxID=1461580 RepID=UPI00059156D3|nr:4-vinyl reductase [Neobacillus jeddahensis]